VKNQTYFISDVHLGAPDVLQSQARERHLVGFLRSISDQCERLFIVGDLFDYWFEYKHVVPRGHTRLLGQLGHMVDEGMELHIFVGNHDLWMGDYLSEELGATIHHQPLQWDVPGTSLRYYIAHGDGLGPGDRKYKALKKLFTNPLDLGVQEAAPELRRGFCRADVPHFEKQPKPGRPCLQRREGTTAYTQSNRLAKRVVRCVYIWAPPPRERIGPSNPRGKRWHQN